MGEIDGRCTDLYWQRNRSDDPAGHVVFSTLFVLVVAITLIDEIRHHRRHGMNRMLVGDTLLA